MSKLMPVRISSNIPSINAGLLTLGVRFEYRFDRTEFTNATISLSAAAVINDNDTCILVITCHQINARTSLSDAIVAVSGRLAR